jgi:aminoglycoside 2'-N-acetyltransferase I
MTGPSPVMVSEKDLSAAAPMKPAIEIHDGDAGWPLAESLDREIYPPEIMATVIWRDISWAHANIRFFARIGGDAVSHAGLYLRRGTNNGENALIGGIGGVMTLPRARRQGCAEGTMRAAAETMRGEGCDFGLLFCESHNVAFYERLGWGIFPGDVFCEQPAGRMKFDMMHTMVLPVASTPRPTMIDLCGLPW